MAKLITVSCKPCKGWGRLDALGRPTSRRDGRRCPNCSGTGTVKAPERRPEPGRLVGGTWRGPLGTPQEELQALAHRLARRGR